MEFLVCFTTLTPIAILPHFHTMTHMFENSFILSWRTPSMATCICTNERNAASRTVSCGSSLSVPADYFLLLYTQHLLWWLDICDALTLKANGFETPQGNLSHLSDEAILRFALSRFTGFLCFKGICLKTRKKKDKLMTNLPGGYYC